MTFTVPEILVETKMDDAVLRRLQGYRNHRIAALLISAGGGSLWLNNILMNKQKRMKFDKLAESYLFTLSLVV